MAGPIEDAVLERLRSKALGAMRISPVQHRSRLRAAILVVCDLARQGWTFTRRDESISVWPPRKVKDLMAEKERVREQLHVERDRQLKTEAVQGFVRRMETRRLYQDRFVSIFSLMRDGRELAEHIEQGRDLGGLIQPYIQLIEGEETCPDTGLKLRDIWRYFRHTWATPYRSTPGRSVMILIRDRAVRPNPVVGIAVLSSAAAQIRERDSWIGWTADQVIEELRSCPDEPGARWLRGELERVLGEIYIQDFLEDGLLVPSDLQTPRAGVANELLAEAERQRAAHVRFVEASRLKKSPEIPLSEPESELQLSTLQRRQIDWRVDPDDSEEDDGDEDADGDETGAWEERARSHLFRSKRAIQLAKLLRARAALAPLFQVGPTAAALEEVLSSADGVRAVRDLARRAKADRMGVHVAEISICGAVQPYSTLLGGKLVSMLLTSPEVLAAYARRYSAYQSLIASSKAGRPIVRGAELSLLMTTSLYGSGSSQYSRLRIPCERVGGRAGEQVRYAELGKTRGFGTSHFSDETVEALTLLISQAAGGRKVNSIFGEGVNPRLRKVREGLSLLGFPDDALLIHGSPRIIYGISLVRNLREHLLGVDEHPEYLLAQDRLSERTEQIVSWWIERWLSRRARRPDVLARVRTHRLVLPPQHGARVPMPEEEASQQVSLFGDG